MSIERGSDFGSSFRLKRQTGRELSMAPFAHAQKVGSRFDDAELSVLHDSSLPPSREPVDFKRHRYPILGAENRAQSKLP